MLKGERAIAFNSLPARHPPAIVDAVDHLRRHDKVRSVQPPLQIVERRIMLVSIR